MVKVADSTEALATAEAAIQALDRELVNYRSELTAWADGVRRQSAHETKLRQERLAERARELDDHDERQKAKCQELDARCAEVERLRGEADARLAECEERERALSDRADHLSEQKRAAEECARTQRTDFEKAVAD